MTPTEMIDKVTELSTEASPRTVRRREVDERTRAKIYENLAQAAGGGSSAIDLRLREIEAEWDLERTFSAAAATIGLAGLTLGLTVNRRFHVIPVAIAALLLEHAVQGWSPLVPVLRRFGVRTADEIAVERHALKVLRGDFEKTVPPSKLHGRGVKRAVKRALEAEHD